MRLLFIIFTTLLCTANATESISGQYIAVTETEYAINLSLQSNGKAVLTLKLYASDKSEQDREESFDGDWKIDGTKIHLDFGKAGFVNYEIQQCLPFKEFGYEGCGLGLTAIETNTKSNFNLMSYSLWRKDVLPFRPGD